MKFFRLVKQALLFACLGIALVGCSSTPSQIDRTSLSDLKKLSPDKMPQHMLNVNNLRNTMLRETALGLGARAGLAHRAMEINSSLEKNAALLDRIFYFEQLMLENHLLPPVLSEARNTVDLNDSSHIRFAERSYSITKPARFVTTAPTWREYLLLPYEEPEIPDRTLLPRNEDERHYWQYMVSSGWNAGIAQAENIFSENLGLLKRDFEGMIRYRALLAEGIVSPPFVARTELGVTNSQDAVSVNDRILKITGQASLQTDPSSWKTDIRLYD